MNLKELSDSLGLSQTTVSRALNGYSDVSEATRKRVMEMAQKIGYAPNAMARRLAMGKANAIGLVYPLDSTYLGDPRFLEVIEGVTDRFNQLQIDVFLASAGKGEELETYRRMIRDQRVDGLIVARTRLQDARISFLKEANFPFVSYGRTADPSGFAWFDFDNVLGMQLAVERLVAFGHKRIAYVHAPLDLTFANQRHQGFSQAMSAAGLAVEPKLVREAGFERRKAYAVMGEILKLRQRPTAVLVDNNQAGVGAVRAVLDAGLRLGTDFSVITYDGVPHDSLFDPADVTAIEQPTSYEAGEKMVDMMVDVLLGKPVSELQVLWRPIIHPGKSDGPAPG